MATSTFDKRIVIDSESAELLAKAIEQYKEPTKPDVQKKLEESEREWQKLLFHYKK